jgi:hypothetical protein
MAKKKNEPALSPREAASRRQRHEPHRKSGGIA